MALIPLNTFKTKTTVLTTATNARVYTAPVGTTAIVLMANVANIDNYTTATIAQGVHAVTFAHYRNLPVLPDAQGNGGQGGNITTELVSAFQIPPNDSANMIPGKMIIEQLDSIVAYTDAPSVCKLTLSILETANQ
jgi:hypothetical protein